MKFKLPKLPFGKSAPEDFDDLDEDLGDAPPPAEEDDEGVADEGVADEGVADEGVADEDGPTKGKASKGKAKKCTSRKKLILVASALLAVAVGGGVTGYFLVIGGDPAPHQAEQAPAPNDNGASVSMSLSGFNEQPPEQQPEKPPKQALLSPPKKVTDTTAQTDTSSGRRPWLQVTPDSPDGGIVPGGIAVDGAGTPPNVAPAPQTPADPSAPPLAQPPQDGQAAPADPPQQAATLPQDTAPAQDPAMAPTPEMSPMPVAKVSADGIPQLVDPPMPTPVKTTEPPRPPMWNDLKDAITVPPLDPAPMDGLQEDTPNGKLPIISAEGIKPWNAYGRPFQERGNARAAIIITGLGMRKVATEMAIKSLPAQVTLAFSPYASNLNEWIAKARLKGHEVLISLPMESNGFPARDPGPYGVLTLLSAQENNTRLLKVLGKTTGYVGVIGDKGDRFLKTSQFISPVLEQLGQRGLLYVDNGAGMKAAAVAPASLHYATSELIVDEKLFKESIQARLRYLISVAQKRGHVTAIASATPGTMLAIVEWAAKLPPTKVELAPITAVVNK